ncbi:MULTISPECIES: phosphopantetheine-binding protein [Dactylosporangium]|uniref:Polyketide biosynthesis acyl-carrier-protein AcpK n=2 Tax=Dactylosporangium TaxID=35753 RepID=A0A9W6KQD5_9ACTN|nr:MULTISPECIES: phosphopantetheine-binding protein [Dactylosporangium]UAB93875.1 phosphopantetheine-binding protein [Dactylosporangium vinaceum]GLL05332.1 polyketide biosynthesis acyl-carrier-protein AcpK [Dactylosporangium matsuzakiense]
MDDLVMEAIRRSVLEVLPELEASQVTEEVSLTDLGANSIDRTDVVTMTMDDLGVSVPVGEFRDVRDIGSLARLLRRHSP